MTINHLANALSYCERGGQLLDSHLCLGSSKDILLQMKRNNALNDRCAKKSFHIKIRIAPEDKGKLQTQDWIDISKGYAKRIGFHNNPYVTYIHEEFTAKAHIHIVASRIKSDLRAVNNGFTNYKNMDFCRDMEKKYNLRKVVRKLEKYRKKEKFVTNDIRITDMREKIKNAIKNTNDTEAAIQYLRQFDIKVKMGRGINFIDSDGVIVKGSQIDRNLSLKGFLRQTAEVNLINNGRSH